MIISVIFMIFYDVFLPLQAIIISRGFNLECHCHNGNNIRGDIWIAPPLAVFLCCSHNLRFHCSLAKAKINWKIWAQYTFSRTGFAKKSMCDFVKARWLTVCLSLSLQYSFQLCSCGGGFALPVLLAAHLHPCAAHLHGGHRLLSHALPSRYSVQLTTKAQGAASGGGTWLSLVTNSQLCCCHPSCLL